MKVKLIFNDNSTFEGEYSEEAIDDFYKQMSRPQNKRLYTYGIEFSEVKNIEVTKEK